MVNCPVILSGWIWVYQTLRRNRTPWMNASVFTKFESLLSGYLHSFVLNSAQFSGLKKLFEMWLLNSCWWKSSMQKACCPCYASLFFENVLKKRVWSWTLWIEIYLVAYGFWHDVCCLIAPIQWNRKVCFCHLHKICCFFRWEKDRKGISEVLRIYHNVRIMSRCVACMIGALWARRGEMKSFPLPFVSRSARNIAFAPLGS